MINKKHQIKFLESDEIQLYFHLGVLRGTRKDDRSYLRVVPRRMFPISLREQYISLRDTEQNEIGIVKNPESLDEVSRKALEIELRRQYFVPLIIRIFNIRDQLGIFEWHVETDRGMKVFFTKGFYRHLLETDRGFLITDLDKNRFEIRDLDEMDAQSRRIFHSMG